MTAALTSTTPFDRALIAQRLFTHRVPTTGCEGLLHRLITRIPDDASSPGFCSHLGLLLVDQIYMTEGPEGLTSQ